MFRKGPAESLSQSFEVWGGDSLCPGLSVTPVNLFRPLPLLREDRAVCSRGGLQMERLCSWRVLAPQGDAWMLVYYSSARRKETDE